MPSVSTIAQIRFFYFKLIYYISGMELFILKRKVSSQKFEVIFPKGSLLIRESMGGGYFAYRRAWPEDFEKGKTRATSLYISLNDKEVSPIEWVPLKRKK